MATVVPSSIFPLDSTKDKVLAKENGETSLNHNPSSAEKSRRISTGTKQVLDLLNVKKIKRTIEQYVENGMNQSNLDEYLKSIISFF